MSGPDPEKARIARGYSLALTSALVLSTTAILIRHLTETYGLPALILAFWRDLIVSLSLLAGLAVLRPGLLGLARQHRAYLLAFGLVMAVFNSLWTLSVAWNGAAVATVLAYCSAAFTALLGWWFLKETLGWDKLLAVVVSLAGCVLVANAFDPSAWQVNPVGILTGIASGLLWAVYSLMGRSASRRGLDPWTTLFYTFTLAAVFLLVFNLLGAGRIPGAAARPAELFWLADSWTGWGVLILLAAGPTLAGFGLYNLSLVHLPSSVVNLVATSEPAFTALIAFFLLGERLNGLQLAGSALILAAVVLLRLREARPGRTGS